VGEESGPADEDDRDRMADPPVEPGRGERPSRAAPRREAPDRREMIRLERVLEADQESPGEKGDHDPNGIAGAPELRFLHGD
jgi:hypothetical protein